MDQFTVKMAKYKKELINKAVNTLRKDDKLIYCFYTLHILKLNDIRLHHELYDFGATARFKLNWLNPITWILAITCFISAMVCGDIEGIIACVENIKQGIIVYFE